MKWAARKERKLLSPGAEAREPRGVDVGGARAWQTVQCRWLLDTDSLLPTLGPNSA